MSGEAASLDMKYKIIPQKEKFEFDIRTSERSEKMTLCIGRFEDREYKPSTEE